MFGSLREIGEGRGFKVFYRPPKGGGSEFLLDLIWYSDGGGIELGAECQWNHPLGEDMRDIKKVAAYVKSPLKVLVMVGATQIGRMW